jgi:cupin fold WbuC family metalloprotein
MNTQKPFPKALHPPSGDVILIDDALIRQGIEASRTSPRGRIIYPLHKTNSDLLHRMLNIVQPMSYIQPHRHQEPPKVESFLVLRGSILFFTFTSQGSIENCFHLSADGSNVGVDVEPGVFHTFAATVDDTVLFEVKQGPYQEISDKDFAAWAPVEGTPETGEYLTRLYGFGEGKRNEGH